MKTTKYQIGDTAYIVKHWPFWPSEEEKKRLENAGKDLHDIAWNSEENDVFDSLTRAIKHARTVARGSFYGFVEVFEARLTNPYSDVISDDRIKRSELTWEPTGGYEAEVER